MAPGRDEADNEADANQEAQLGGKADHLPSAASINMAICSRRQQLERRETEPFPGRHQRLRHS
jgi:hypothetical protein